MENKQSLTKQYIGLLAALLCSAGAPAIDFFVICDSENLCVTLLVAAGGSQAEIKQVSMEYVLRHHQENKELHYPDN